MGVFFLGWGDYTGKKGVKQNLEGSGSFTILYVPVESYETCIRFGII